MLRRLILLAVCALAPFCSAHAESLPRPKSSTDLDLFVGASRNLVRVLWIPKTWPLGMEGVQIMRRSGTEPWTPVQEMKQPSEALRNRLEAAQTPQQFAEIRRDLRSAWREPLFGGFGLEDRDSAKIPDGVVEYGAFPQILGARSAEPVATAFWRVGSEMDADYGITGPRVIRDGKGWVALFTVDNAKMNQKAGNLRALQVTADGRDTLYAWVMDGGGPRRWKYLCVPIEPGQTKSVKFIGQNLFGFGTVVSMPIEAAPSAATDAAAMAQCFVPTPERPPVGPLIGQGDPLRPKPPPPIPAAPPPGVTPQAAPPPQPAPETSAPRASPPDYREPAPTPINAGALLEGARLWLDASHGVSVEGGRVAAWRDHSGNGFVATMTDPSRRPTLELLSNDTATIRFHGRQSLHLERPIEMRSGTILIVGRSGGDRVRNIILGPVGNNSNHQLRWEDAESAMIVGPYHGSNIVQFPVGDTTALHVLGVRYDGTSVGFWRNGRPSNTWVFRKPPDEPYSFNSIGSYYSQMFLRGDIVAIVWLPQALTRPEIESVDRLLRDRYRVP